MTYKVTIKPSGSTFEVGVDEHLLDAAIHQGLHLPYSCRNGRCGSCKATLLSGEVRYAGERPPALSDEDQSRGQVLLCQGLAMGDLEVQVREIAGVGGIQPRIMPVRVAKMERLAPDVMRLYLKLPAGQRLMYLAGQYIDVLLKDGRRRSFSIANPPHDDEFIELHIRHVPGGHFTGHVFEHMKEKALLRIEAPLGNFFLREDSNAPIIMMAGGTGFGPLKGMIEHAMHTGCDRPIYLFWGARKRVDLYLHDLVKSWMHDHAALFSYTAVLSEPLEADHWQGDTGWVHDAVLSHYPALNGFDVYMSGPPPMVEAARESFISHGLDPDRLYFDSFEFAL